MKSFTDAELETTARLLAVSPRPAHLPTKAPVPPPAVRPLGKPEIDAVHAFYGEGSVLAEHVVNTARFVLVLMEYLAPGNATERFRALLEYEWIEQLRLTGSPRYRDHITHPAKNLVFGEWLLAENGDSLLRTVAGCLRDSPQIREQMRLCNAHVTDWEGAARTIWWITSLFHDFMYPVQSHIQDQKRVNDISPPSVKCCTRWCPSAIPTAARNGPLFGPLFTKRGYPRKRAASKPHALHSALGILDFANDPAISPAGAFMCIVAAHAVCRHHNDVMVVFQDDPILFLLRLADETQAWGRQFIYRKAQPNRQGFSVRFLDECPKLCAELTATELRLTFHRAVPGTLRLTGWQEGKFREPLDALLLDLDCAGGFPQISYTV